MLTLPIMYFKTGSDLSQITHFEVNYPDDFVKQAWERQNTISSPFV